MEPFPISRRLSWLFDGWNTLLPPSVPFNLLSLGCEQPGAPLQYEIFRRDLGAERPQALQLLYPFEEIPHDWFFQRHGAARFPANTIPAAWRAAGSTDETWQSVPLAVFEAPVACLLLPETSPAPVAQLHTRLLEALWQELDECFSDDYLLSLETPAALVQAFRRVLLPWLAPCHHHAGEEEPGQVYATWPANHDAVQRQLLLRAAHQEFQLYYTFPHQSSPADAGRLPALQRYFERDLYHRWERQHHVGAIWNKLDHIDRLLVEVKQALRQHGESVAPRSTDLGRGGQESIRPFSFYGSSDGKKWCICWRGAPVGMLTSSETLVGLEAIRILLQHPNRHFPAPELYQINKFNKGQKSIPDSDPQKDKAYREELLKEMTQLQGYLNGRPKPQQAIHYSLLLREVLGVLLSHEPHNMLYRQRYGLVSEAIKQFLVTNDDNFDPQKYKGSYNHLKPTGNYHDTVTTISKGIKAAIENLDHPDLRQYLFDTLVRKNRSGLKPFEYAPGLDTQHIALRPEEWDTGNPT